MKLSLHQKYKLQETATFDITAVDDPLFKLACASVQYDPNSFAALFGWESSRIKHRASQKAARDFGALAKEILTDQGVDISKYTDISYYLMHNGKRLAGPAGFNSNRLDLYVVRVVLS